MQGFSNRSFGCIHTPQEKLVKIPQPVLYLGGGLGVVGAGPLPDLADSTDYFSRWRKQMVVNGLLGNGTWGDCVIVGVKCNLPGTQAANSTGTLLYFTEAQALSDYAEITGFAYTQATDNGTDPLDALNFYKNNGSILAFGQVNVRNPAHLAAAIEYFGGVAIALDIPGSWEGTTNWDVATDNIVGGHLVVLSGYNAQGNYIVETWAEDPPPVLTPAAISKYAQAGWVTVDNDWVAQNQQTLQGFNLQQLQQDLALVA